MDNNSFENEFIQNVKQTTRPPAKPSIKPGAGGSKLPLVIALVTSFIVLIESIILVTFTVNYFNKDREDDDDENISVYDDSPESLSEEGAFTLDDSYAITAFNLTCTSEDGSKYVFKKAKTYQKSDATSTTIDSGNYAILNETAVILNSDNSSSDEESIVYYDGVYVIEGKTFYECKEDISK